MERVMFDDPRREAFPARARRLRIAAALAFLACGCERKDESNVYAPPPPPEVIVATPVEREVVQYLSYTGVIEPSLSVELRARVEGFLAKIAFEPGQRVKKGDVLIEIDPREYVTARDGASSAVDAHAAALIGAESDAKLARELADQKAGPEIDALIKAAKRDAVKAELESARARLEEAKLNLEFCKVTAPIDGRVSENYVDEGNLVGRGEPTLLAKIVQSVPAYVALDINESDVLAVRRLREKAGPREGAEPGQITPGVWQPCELAIKEEMLFRFKGAVDYVDPEMNAQTGTLRVRTQYANADEALLPGLFAHVRFPMTTVKAMLVSEAALLSDQQGRYAFVVNDQNTVEVRRVEVGVLESDMRVVEKGLAATDRVIVLGVLKVRPGAKVTPKQQQAQPAAAAGG